MGALYKGFWTTVVLSIPAIYLATQYVLGDMNAVLGGSSAHWATPGVSTCLLSEATAGATALTFTGMKLFWCMMVGLALTGVLVWITEYYTGTNYRPVKSDRQGIRDTATAPT